MNEQTQSVVRDQAGATGTHLVQAGWQVNDSRGDRIGKVLSRDGEVLTVQLEGGGDPLAIPTRLIAEEEEGGMLAVLSVAEDELQDAIAHARGDDAETLLT